MTNQDKFLEHLKRRLWLALNVMGYTTDTYSIPKDVPAWDAGVTWRYYYDKGKQIFDWEPYNKPAAAMRLLKAAIKKGAAMGFACKGGVYSVHCSFKRKVTAKAESLREAISDAVYDAFCEDEDEAAL